MFHCISVINSMFSGPWPPLDTIIQFFSFPLLFTMLCLYTNPIPREFYSCESVTTVTESKQQPGIQIPVPAGPQRQRRYTFPARLKVCVGGKLLFTDTTTTTILYLLTEHSQGCNMPKLLFSKIRFNEIRDLIQNVKRPRR